MGNKEGGTSFANAGELLTYPILLRNEMRAPEETLDALVIGLVKKFSPLNEHSWAVRSSSSAEHADPSPEG